MLNLIKAALVSLGLVAAQAVALADTIPLDPVAWHPPAAHDPIGLFRPNGKLRSIAKMAAGDLVGPETVAIGPDQRLYTGYAGGKILSYKLDGSDPKVVADTRGRPLGLHHFRNGDLIVADSDRGLLRVGMDGTIKVLTASFGGVPLVSIDDVALAPDERTVYFSDASSKFPMSDYTGDILEHGGHGRVFAYDMATGNTRLLFGGINFANGLLVHPGGASLLVNETGSYRILRHWLSGERAGTTEVFIDNLPGYPDNLSFNGKDRIWVALVKPRLALLDRFAAPHPAMRRFLGLLPRALIGKSAAKVSQAVAVDLDGKAVAYLQDQGDAAFASITTVLEKDGWLYFGSLTEPAIGRMPAEPGPPTQLGH